MRSIASVAQGDEFNLGQDVGATPEFCKEKRREHAPDAHIPPEPVAGDALLHDQFRHRQRCISCESRGYHRDARQIPRKATPTEEKFAEVFASTFGIQQCNANRKDKVGNDQDPINQFQSHGAMLNCWVKKVKV